MLSKDFIRTVSNTVSRRNPDRPIVQNLDAKLGRGLVVRNQDYSGSQTLTVVENYLSCMTLCIMIGSFSKSMYVLNV